MTTNHPGQTAHRLENTNTNGRPSPEVVARTPNQPMPSVLDDFCSWLITSLGKALAALQAGLGIALRWIFKFLVDSCVWFRAVLVDLFLWLRSLNWPLVVWNVFTVPVVALIYWVVNAHGLRLQIPIFAMRLYKIPLPGFAHFRDYEGLYVLDLAHVMAILLLGFVWYFWIIVVQVIVYGHDSLVSPSDRRSTYYVFLLTLAGVVVICDAIVFYCGLFEFSGGWGDSNPFVPFIATVLYTALLAALAMVHVRLSARRKQMP